MACMPIHILFITFLLNFIHNSSGSFLGAQLTTMIMRVLTITNRFEQAEHDENPRAVFNYDDTSFPKMGLLQENSFSWMALGTYRDVSGRDLLAS